ncbi:uncharacterized protein LOC124647942 [Lolium rigidum]|uniref:uncharacterized protein LOC124647942 n=1 Tax=Lolium rigidum TaxID=89674 RepID=UPI001F5D0F4C|nr:uncharacterized protein LOC124647942 [Lolium rigidum]
MEESTHLAALCKIADLKRSKQAELGDSAPSASSQNMNWRLGASCLFSQLVVLSSPGLLAAVSAVPAKGEMGRPVVSRRRRSPHYPSWPPHPPTIPNSPPRPLACAPAAVAIEMMSSSSGSGSRYLDPHLVYELVIRRMPRQLLDYLDSIPGSSQDLHCYRIKLVGETLLSPPRKIPEENRWIMILGKRAWGHAIYSRLCAPPMVDNPTNFTSDAGHSMHLHNSSLYSGRMLTNEPELSHAAMLDELSASRSRNHAATFPPLKENSNDVMLHETSAYNFRTHASAYAPSRAQALEEIMQNIVSPDGTLELGTFWLCHPGSEQFTLQGLPPNRKRVPTVNMKGKRYAASEVDQIKVEILRVNVASLVAQDGLDSAAGVLIRNGSTAQFISASCFSPILRTEPTLLFAAACCEAIKIALSYQPTTIVLESHLLFSLRNPLYADPNQQPDIVQLTEFLSQGHPHFILQSISEESNLAACRLALNVLHIKESYMFFNDPPEWLVPYLGE